MKLTTEERAQAADACRGAGLFELADKLAPGSRGRPRLRRNAIGLTEHQARMRELRDAIQARIDDNEDDGEVILEFTKDPRLAYMPARKRYDFLLNLLSNRSDLVPKKIRPNYPT